MATVAKPITTEFGHSLPPETPHSVTTHAPGWDTIFRFRDADMSLFMTIKSLYPRFSPWGPARELAVALGQKLGATPPAHGLVMFTNPGAFAMQTAWSTSHHRNENKVPDGTLAFKVVEVHGTRLYCVIYPMSHTPGVIGGWQNSGIGLSSRASEELLKHIDTDFHVVDWDGDLDNLPAASYQPEVDAHRAVRRRIRDLLHRAPIDPANVKVAEDDVFLYQTGMAAIYNLNSVLFQRDQGQSILLGSIFHNTFHLLEDTSNGMKHFGACGPDSGIVAKLDEYLDARYKNGQTVSYLFIEFPSNPILVSADLHGIRKITEKYNIPFVVDDTIGSFANIDVLSVADILLSSLTKSFSGYADVMGGSVVLNPLSPFYPDLKPAFTSAFHNELFAGDAEKLLSNSNDYLPRSTILNRNAEAVASFLHQQATNTTTAISSSTAALESPIKAVLYPTTSPTQANYDAVKRPATPDFTPGYGCLLAVEFKTLEAAAAFYDAFPVHKGPHLGAHRTLALPMNLLTYSKEPKEAAYHAAYGAGPEQIRISVGLEPVDDLIAAVKAGLIKATEVYGSKS
ncbi:pyridoxal phosphate-dependent transferase [Coniella lustricola]|uniref:Pyridoxal phosphate-dependent transferase n=1 Tax=Coniella lustricola TaxID=2025994 RepID=A0A2T3A4L1_9PEZI|nr:pyridoxal phosphate-dependent transferase [Coniella lustricola]